jgi:hypothetical protein
MRDDIILARSIHPLQHDQNRPMTVGVRTLLQLREAFNVGSKKFLSFVLVEVNATAGSKEASRKLLGSSMRKCLSSFVTFMGVLQTLLTDVPGYLSAMWWPKPSLLGTS